MKPWEHYTYRVSYSPEDREFVGLCTELSGLSWLARTPEAALRGIRNAARQAVEILVADGEGVPEPLSAKTYSGIFKVRIPPEVHRQLALDAAEQGVSMNRLVSAKLTAGKVAGERPASTATPRRKPASERPPRRSHRPSRERRHVG